MRLVRDRGQLHLWRPREACAETSALLDRYRETVPCTAQIWDGRVTRLRRRAYALDAACVQHSWPGARAWIAADVDRPEALADLSLAEAAPHLVMRNRVNGHTHALWRLARPVSRRGAPGRFAADLAERLRIHVRGDPGFAGIVAKNPLRPDAWEVFARRARPWTLRGLAARLPALPAPARQARLFPQARYTGYSRNCWLFEELRLAAYRLRGRLGLDAGELEARLAALARRGNAAFALPMPDREAIGIARSIARWTARRLRSAPIELAALQARRGLASGAARREAAADLARAARELRAGGASQREIAAALGASRGAVQRWLTW